MTLRRVEFVEPWREGKEEYVVGDIRSLNKNLADTLVNIGICRDPETGEQSERKVGVHKIQPETVHGVSGVKAP